MQATTTIGLDIAKSVFQVHGIDAEGNVTLRRRVKRRYDSMEALRWPKASLLQRGLMPTAGVICGHTLDRKQAGCALATCARPMLLDGRNQRKTNSKVLPSTHPSRSTDQSPLESPKSRCFRGAR